jgi:hypothetical protein
LRPEDVPRLESTLRSALATIQRQLPHSTLILLSPLAEGADRLAARMALELGIGLVVPLPLPQALYEQDFDTAQSRAEFLGLLGRARARLDLPLLAGATEAKVRTPGHDRNREYAKVGAYIASHSQILFALWDGVTDRDQEKTGGTAQIVRFRLEGVPPAYDSPRSRIGAAPAVGPVRWIVTPRQSHPSVTRAALTEQVLTPDHRTAESFDRLCERMDLFNRDAYLHRDELVRQAEASKRQLLAIADDGGEQANLAQLPGSCAHIVEQYAVADGLALHFGQKTLRASRGVFIGVAVAALFFNLHSNFFSVGRAPWFLILFLGSSTVTAIWIHGRARRGEYQNKYQDYRALAEALRIQFLWRVAGVRTSVVDAYLRKQRSELEWLRSALRSWGVRTTIEDATGTWPSDAPALQGLPLVVHWVQGQRRYFASKVTREKRQLDRETRMVKGLLKLSGGLSVALALLLSIRLLPASAMSTFLQRVVPTSSEHASLMVLIPMLAVLAGVLNGYGDQLARSEHIRQFGRMADLFDAGGRELERLLAANDHAGVTNLVLELGTEALEENGDWLLLHRERPLEVPAG